MINKILGVTWCSRVTSKGVAYWQPPWEFSFNVLVSRVIDQPGSCWCSPMYQGIDNQTRIFQTCRPMRGTQILFGSFRIRRIWVFNLGNVRAMHVSPFVVARPRNHALVLPAYSSLFLLFTVFVFRKFDRNVFWTLTRTKFYYRFGSIVGTPKHALSIQKIATIAGPLG
jgi:hypothetical protein